MLLFNRYEYNPQTDFIGKGGFSKVYKAYDKKFQRWVALKIYKTSELSERYSPMAEIQRVINLDHPNICRYIDFEEIEKEDSLGEIEKIQVGVMELLDGGNFSKYYRSSNDLSVFKKLLTDVLYGLSYLHRKGIIHRDIKPANILIKETDNGPVAKITDFGISKKSGSANSGTSSALIVSIPYMAPEQLNVQKYGIDEKVSYNIDFWSLGVTVFEVITGQLLFKNHDNDTSEQIMMNILSTEVPEKINLLPMPYRRFVEQCLKKDAKQRVQLAEDLLAILNAEPMDHESGYAGPVGEDTVFMKKEKGGRDTEMDETRLMSKTVKNKDNSQTEQAHESVADSDETRLIPSVADSDETRLIQSAADSDETRLIQSNEIKMDSGAETAEIPRKQEEQETQLLSGSHMEQPTEILSRKNDSPGKTAQTEPLSNTSKQIQTAAFLNQKDGVVVLFGRYEYKPDKDLIGKGGFSRVYRAYDKKLSRWVALKIYKVEDFSDRYSPIAEIKRVISFDHPNICRYLDIEEIEKRNLFGENETVQVCVMELLDSGNFSEYYKKNQNLDTFKKLLNDVFSGLSYLHKNGIIHRDIKPANILIKQTMEGPVAKITDFGISKKSDSVNSESSSALIVSIPYMAPEQLNVKKYGLDDKIRYNLDLWSLGVTIYEVLTGNLLFKNSENESSEQIMANIMAPELPDKINEIPQPYRDIVRHCVVKNAKDRAQKVEELMVLLNTSTMAVRATISAGTEEKITMHGKSTEGSVVEPEFSKVTERNPEPTRRLPVSIFVADEPEIKRKRTGKDRSESEVRIRQKRPLNIPVIILSAVVLLSILLFFYFRYKRSTENNYVINTDTVRKIKQPDKIVLEPPRIIPATDVQPKTNELKKTPADSAGKKHTTPLPVPNHNVTDTRNAIKANHQTVAPRIVKNLSEQLLVKFSTNEPCRIVMKNVNTGVQQDEELLSGQTIRLYLKPGKYIITATSLRDASKTRTYPFDIKQEDVNQIVNYRISF
jgi:serine/threonine protein kinase